MYGAIRVNPSNRGDAQPGQAPRTTRKRTQMRANVLLAGSPAPHRHPPQGLAKEQGHERANTLLGVSAVVPEAAHMSGHEHESERRRRAD